MTIKMVSVMAVKLLHPHFSNIQRNGFDYVIICEILK